MQAHVQTLSRLLPEEEIQNLLSSNSIPANETPLWKYWAEFVEWYLGKGRSKETVRRVRDSVRFFVRNTHIKTIETANDHITLEKALDVVKKERHVSHVTLNTYAKSLGTYFAWLKYYRYISENEVRQVTTWKGETNEQEIYSEEQVQLIKAQIHNRVQNKPLERYRNTVVVDFFAHFGIRPVELLHIKVSDVELVKGKYRVMIRGAKQKGRIRYYEMPNYIKDSFEIYLEHLKKIGRANEFLFISSSNNTRWTDKGMRGLFRNISKELGFTVTAYAFRRFVATKQYEIGVPLEKISKYLGHNRVKTTEHYIGRSVQLTQAGNEAMEQILQCKVVSAKH